MKNLYCILLIFCFKDIAAQYSKDYLIQYNQKIDQAVVSKDTTFLITAYASDFIFSHGTGLVEGKDSWLKAVKNPKTIFVSRQHDSVTVEIHKPGIYILHGKLVVNRKHDSGISKYGLYYTRVYTLQDDVLQMISHKTTKEWHFD